MTTASPAVAGTSARSLRTLYLVRFGFALVWAALLVLTASRIGPALTVLLVLYPLADAAAVVVQLRSGARTRGPRPAEVANVVLSVLAAVALGWTSTLSIGAALVTWGVWALLSGALQLITAVLRRRAGGQVPLIISGAISVLAGVAFSLQGAQGATTATGVGGYAVLGGIFFLIAAIRLAVLLRREG